MILQEITERELSVNGVVSLPTRPGASREFGGRSYTPTQLKEAFDRLPRLIAERYNQLLHAIEEGEIAESFMVMRDGEPVTLKAYLEDIFARTYEDKEDILELREGLASLSEMQVALTQLIEQLDWAIGKLDRRTKEDNTYFQEQVKNIRGDIVTLFAIAEETVVARTTYEDTFSARITPDWMQFIDGADTTVRYVRGNTIIDGAQVKHAVFTGIESENADGTKRDGMYFEDEVVLGLNDVLDLKNQTATKATTVATFPYSGGDIFYWWTTDANAANGVFIATVRDNTYFMAQDVASAPSAISGGYSKTSATSGAGMGDMTYMFNIATNGEHRLYIRNTQYTNISAFKTYLSNMEKEGTPLVIVYKGANAIQQDAPCPHNTYQAFSGGTEIILPEGETVTVTQDFYVKVGA